MRFLTLLMQRFSRALKENPWHTEGKNNKEWMLLDYIDVVAHVFRKDRREFYALERLWGDADITEIDRRQELINLTTLLI